MQMISGKEGRKEGRKEESGGTGVIRMVDWTKFASDMSRRTRSGTSRGAHVAITSDNHHAGPSGIFFDIYLPANIQGLEEGAQRSGVDNDGLRRLSCLRCVGGWWVRMPSEEFTHLSDLQRSLRQDRPPRRGVNPEFDEHYDGMMANITLTGEEPEDFYEEMRRCVWAAAHVQRVLHSSRAPR
jgi:hypothetical protein